MAVAQLTQVAPFPWLRFLQGAELGAVDRVVLAEFTAIKRIVALYATTPIATLKAWQAFHLVDATVPYLSRRFVAAHFHFHETTLAGVARPAERWKRGVRLVDSEMGDAIGRVYVARYLSSQTKAQIDDMVTQIRLALTERLERIAWISRKTKEKALNKLSRLTVKSGYPKVWRDYSRLEIEAGELLGSIQNARMFNWARRVSRLGSPVDRNEWDTTPQTINSGYSSNLNEVVLPAGQLQAPYFDPAADCAVNYGGIGAIIGHELTTPLMMMDANTTRKARSRIGGMTPTLVSSTFALPSLLDSTIPSSPCGNARERSPDHKRKHRRSRRSSRRARCLSSFAGQEFGTCAGRLDRRSTIFSQLCPKLSRKKDR
jgi:putative endopeptidase